MYGIQTSCNGKLIESAGEVRVKAYQDGQQVFLRENVNFSLFVDDPDPIEQAELFYAFNTNLPTGIDPDSIGNTDWIEVDQDSSSQSNVSRSEAMPSQQIGWIAGYESFPDNLGWINVDYFNKLPQTGSLLIETPDQYDNSNTRIYLYFHDLNSVLELWFFNNRYFTKGPIGETVSIISISSFGDDNFKYSETEVLISGDETIQIEPEFRSHDDIVEAIMNIDN